MNHGSVRAPHALSKVLDELDVRRVRRMARIGREGREGPYGLRFDHAGVLVFPGSVDGALAGLEAEGLPAIRMLPSVVVRDRLASRYGLDRPDVLIAHLDVGEGRTLELFMATGCPGHVADDERLTERETHLAFETTGARLGVLEALRADGFVPDGGGFNPAEGDQGRSLFYFRDGPDGDRLEILVAGEAASELSRHLGQADHRRRMLELLTGAWQTQALRTAAELGIADWLLGHELTLAELADATGCPADRLGRLLRYLQQLGAIDTRDGLIRLTPLGATLSHDDPSSLHGVALLYGGLFYRSFGELPGSVRSGTSGFELAYGAAPFRYLDAHPNDASIFQRAMADQCRDVFDAIADKLDLSGVGVITDVGGGRGALLSRILKRAPHVSGVLFDTPATTAAARDALRGSSISVVGGDLFTQVPGGDLLMLSRVLHDWDDAACARILQRCRAAMRTGGRLAVVERLLSDTPGAAPLAAAWDVNMMINNTGGRERTLDEYDQLLRTAGFELASRTDLLLEICLLEAVAI